MRHHILNILLALALFIGGAFKAVAQERPKLREISDKKLEVALQGVVPMEKKGECGYADSQGKFVQIFVLFMSFLFVHLIHKTIAFTFKGYFPVASCL